MREIELNKRGIVVREAEGRKRKYGTIKYE